MPSSVIRTGPEVAAKLSDTAQMLRARMEGLDRPSVGLALGSGAARGLAHIGVLKALLANAIAIDVMVGCSIGAVVGGCYAAGVEPDQMEDIARSIDKRIVFRHLDFAVPNRGGLIAGSVGSAQELTMNKTFGQLRIGLRALRLISTQAKRWSWRQECCMRPSERPVDTGVFQPVVMGSGCWWTGVSSTDPRQLPCSHGG